MNECDFLIIDTYNMIIRSKTKSYNHKIKQNLIISSFLQTLKSNIDFFKPKKVIMAIDDYIGNSFRRNLIPSYKLYRNNLHKDNLSNEDFKKQKEIILYILEKYLPVYTLKYKGYEADDLIAIISNISSEDINIVIWSTDNDLVQIQQKINNVKLWNPQKRCFIENPKYDYVSYKSLVGKRNEMQGVKGIGRKSAEKILSSPIEFIKLVGSNPKRYLEYRLNRRVVDLLDNELPIPKNIHYILEKEIKYNKNEFEKILYDLKLNKVISKKETYNKIFLNLEKLNNNQQKQWFFNKNNLIK